MVEVRQDAHIVLMANVPNMVVGLVLVAGIYLPKTQVLAEVPFTAQAVGEAVAVLKQPKSVDVEALGVCMPLVVVVPLEVYLLVEPMLELVGLGMIILMVVVMVGVEVAHVGLAEMAAWEAQAASLAVGQVAAAARQQARAAHLEQAAVDASGFGDIR